MVVVPTSNHVRLHYGYTPIDWLGFLVTLAGIAGFVALILLKRVRYALQRARPEPRTPAEPGAGRRQFGRP